MRSAGRLNRIRSHHEFFHQPDATTPAFDFLDIFVGKHHEQHTVDESQVVHVVHENMVGPTKNAFIFRPVIDRSAFLDQM